MSINTKAKTHSLLEGKLGGSHCLPTYRPPCAVRPFISRTFIAPNNISMCLGLAYEQSEQIKHRNSLGRYSDNFPTLRHVPHNNSPGFVPQIS